MKFKKNISFKFKYRVLLFLKKFKSLSYFEDTIIASEKKYAYFFLAADYGNLGDVAITYAQSKFINEKTDYDVIEIPISKTLEGIIFVKKHIKSNDLITLVGGGNLGDMYEQIEYIRQLVVRYFPDNKIISFPQTFDFSETSLGQKALKKAIKVYNSHKNCSLIAREFESYQLMQQYFDKCNVLLAPDIVMSLDESKPNNRNGVVFCMRNDLEKKIDIREEQKIRDIVVNYFNSISDYDTHIGDVKLEISNRLYELEKIWNKFCAAELVITDRLHGMIFCYITSTPCIVISNNNHKVKGCYRWIQNKSNIILLESFDEIKIVSLLENKFYDKKVFGKMSIEFNQIKKYFND